MKKEIRLCKKYWGCYPLYYYRYNLYRMDSQVSEEELLNYIPEFFFYSLFLPFYNKEQYEILLRDKIINEQVLRSVNIDQPYTICKLFNNHFYNNELKEISFDVINQVLAKKICNKLFVKPVDGQGGYGIYIFIKNDAGQYITREGILFSEQFLREICVKNNYIIQAGINQAPEMSKIYPHSVNTLRIATENKYACVRMLCSVLRMGRNGNQVDNCSQDGIVLKIDPTTGAAGNFATSETCEYFQSHPDTNFVFNELKITNWNVVKDFVIESASKMPQFTYIGWDIGLTNSGPLAIEANLGFGLDLYQIAVGGLRETFGIDNPRFYWKNMHK